jgi:hypothetical protein
MGRTLRSVTLGVVLLVPALAPAAAGSSVACSAEAADAPHAALVIGTGGQTLTYCVTLDAPSVTGLRLIQLASAQHGLQYRLGFGGQAVCQLAGVGPTGSDCFADYPDFWGYWHGNGTGGWAWAGSGAASASIGDGDVEGWTWGAGDSGATHPAPPAVGIDDVCDEAEPSPPPDDDGGGGGGSGGGGDGGSGSGGGGDGGDGSGSGGGSGSGTTDQDTGSNGGGASEEEPAGGNGGGTSDGDGITGGGAGGNDGETDVATPATDVPDVTALASDTTPAGNGPPVAGLVALGLIGVLGVAGWITLRRRAAGGG